MSKGRTYSAGPIEFSIENVMRFIPAIAIVGLWCLLSVNSDIDLLSFLMFQAIFVALFIISSAYALEDGTKNVGLVGLAIGLGVYYGSIYLGFTLPISILVLYYVQVAIAIMNVLGTAIGLFGAVAFGLWFARDGIRRDSLGAKYGAPLLGCIVLIVWILLASITIGFPTPIIATLELFFYILLIVVSSIIIPRRQFITIFYFVLGLVLALWGLLNLGPEISLDYYILGYYFRVIGVALISLFTLPLGVSSIYEDRRPEGPLYMIVTLWFFTSFFIPSISAILSPVRVVAIVGVLFFSMKNLRTKSSIFIMLGIIIGFLAPFVDVGLTFLLMMGMISYIVAIAGTFGAWVVCTTIFIFSILSLGGILRTRLGANQKTTLGIGLLFVIAGLVSGLAGLVLFPADILLFDTLFLALVGLGSMLIVIKPGKIMYFGASIGFAMTTMLLVERMFSMTTTDSLRLFFYPSLLLMIFCTIQQSRADTKWLERRVAKRKKKVVPMDITPESVRKAGLYSTKKKTEAPEQPVETIEPVPSTVSEESEVVQPLEPVEQPVLEVKVEEPVEEEVSENAISTVQKRIPEGESLPDEQRMARNWYNRAFGFLDVGDLEAAIKAVETALKWHPDHPQALALKKELSEK